MDNQEIRLRCLEMAMQLHDSYAKPDEVVESAEKFYSFVGSVPHRPGKVVPVRFGEFAAALLGFPLWPHQRDLIDAIETNSVVLVKHCRQIGISTVMRAYAAWRMLNHTDETIMVLTPRHFGAADEASKFRAVYETLRHRYGLNKPNSYGKTSVELGNRSKIWFHPATPDVARGMRLSLLHLTEAGLMRDIDLAALLPSLGTTGRMVISSVSVPGSGFNRFFDDPNTLPEAKRIVLPYWATPVFSAERIATIKKNLSPVQFKHEFCCGLEEPTFPALFQEQSK